MYKRQTLKAGENRIEIADDPKTYDLQITKDKKRFDPISLSISPFLVIDANTNQSKYISAVIELVCKR